VDKKRVALVVFASFIMLGVLYFFFPLLDGIVLGIVFAYVANPVKQRMVGRFGERGASLAATGLVIAPIALILVFGVIEAASQALVLMQNGGELSSRVNESISTLSPQLEDLLRRGLGWAVEVLRSSLQNLPVMDYATGVAMFVLNGFIAIFSCYYFLVDGRKLSAGLKKRISERAYGILQASSERISGVFVGSFYFSIIIALASMPFFIYFDIPFWAIASGSMFLAALVPIFAEWMVLAALSFYVLFVGGTAPFIAFLLIGLVFIYLIPEFLLRPVLVGRYSDTHPLLLLLAFIGGGLAFGVSGFFLAPMLACVAVVLWEEW
jgi:predicted PurR-regulated permease PerM